MTQFARISSIILKSSILALILLGTIFTFIFHDYQGEVFCYYTAQVNMVALLVFAVLLVFDCFGGIRKERYYYMIKFFVTMCSLLSMLVYTGLFTHTEQMKMGGSWYGVVSHVVVPLLLLADYLIFDRRGHLTWYAPLVSALGPVAHVAFILIRSLTGEGYHVQDSPTIVIAPYDFMRSGEFGEIALNCLLVLGGFLLAGYLFYLLDSGYAALRNRLAAKAQPPEKE